MSSDAGQWARLVVTALAKILMGQSTLQQAFCYPVFGTGVCRSRRPAPLVGITVAAISTGGFGDVLLVGGLLVTGAGAWQLLDPPGFAPLEREIFSKAGIVLKAAGLPDSREPSKGVKSDCVNAHQGCEPFDPRS